jgi:cell division protein FtsI/penicillin-binding protein 2
MTRSAKRSSGFEMWRYRMLVGAFALCVVALVWRLYEVQVLQHEQFTAQAEQQYGSERLIPASRGTIKSSDGFDLATTQPAYLISANPAVIAEPAKVAKQLVEAMRPDESANQLLSEKTAFDNLKERPKPAKSKGQEIADLTELLSNKNRSWVLIGRKIEHATAERIRQLKIAGISFELDERRFYPEGTLASHVLGFVGKNEAGKDHGYYGIEGYFNRDLEGRDGKISLEKDAGGNPIPIGRYTSEPVEHGSTITLTINRSLQYLLEQKLKEGVERNRAESGSVIVMEPDTGRILVMANYPTYDPGNWLDPSVQKDQLFKNRAISDAYEPGSIMKAFTATVGMDLNLFSPDTTYKSAPYKVGDHTITTANNKYYGTATLTEMLMHSDNTGAAQFAVKIGRDKFYKALHQIGLDRPTGITLEGEGQSIIPYQNDWLPVTLATAAFGQGISITPLQLLEMMQTIANDGVQMKPTILSSVGKNGVITTVKPEESGRIFSQSTTDKAVMMLEETVKKGEFRRLALQGYELAGKTSTSQIPIAGGYDPDSTITTFVGFAPAKAPKFIMLAKLDKPSINNSAETVVPMWMKMAEDLFHYYGIAPAPVEE